MGKKGREWGIVFSPSQVILDEHEDSVDKVPEVIEQFGVVLGDKVVPAEGAVLRFWSHVEEVEAVDISWYACFLSIGPKHTHPTTLGELSILIVQILCVCVWCVCGGGGSNIRNKFAVQ